MYRRADGTTALAHLCYPLSRTAPLSRLQELTCIVQGSLELAACDLKTSRTDIRFK